MGEGGTGYQSVIFPKPGKISLLHSLACKSGFSARPLAEASPNGTAPAPTAAHFAPEPSTVNPVPKRNSPLARILSIGFSSELLPICAPRSKPLQHFIRKLSKTQLVTRPSLEPFSSMPTSITCSDYFYCASSSLCTCTPQNPFAASSLKTIPCLPCCDAFPIK